MQGLEHSKFNVATLKGGAYFGEIGLITKLKRTANVTSLDYCTLSQMNRSTLKEAKRQFPQIY